MKENTNQLIITYRFTPTKIKHVLVPESGGRQCSQECLLSSITHSSSLANLLEVTIRYRDHKIFFHTSNHKYFQVDGGTESEGASIGGGPVYKEECWQCWKEVCLGARSRQWLETGQWVSLYCDDEGEPALLQVTPNITWQLHHALHGMEDTHRGQLQTETILSATPFSLLVVSPRHYHDINKIPSIEISNLS